MSVWLAQRLFLCPGRGTLPHRPAGPCGHPGCPALTHSRYCVAHEPMQRRTKPDLRPSAARRGYGRRWRAYRLSYLQKHPLCINWESCRHRATAVDHIIPTSRGGSSWDPENHQPMCHSCHSRKTAQENGGFGNLKRKKESRPGQRVGRPSQRSYVTTFHYIACGSR